MRRLLLTIALLVISAAAVPAQNSIEQSIRNARDRSSDIKNRSIELERMKRQANKTPVNDDAAPRFPEIKKDFEEIQKMNSRLIELKIAESPINYASVFKIVSQINRRAVRLNSNLFAAELKEKNNKRAKDEKATTVAPSELPVLLTALDKSIGSFVHNSLFQNINLVNSKDSLKAQTDLETVIKISFSIKEKAKSYKK